MVIHKELTNGFTGTPDKSNQLKNEDVINRVNDPESRQCIHFEVVLDIEYNNKIIQQYFFFDKQEDEGERIWKVFTLIGEVQTSIMYEIPKVDFPLLKTAAMGLMYVRLTHQERMAYYEALNYELLERTEGL